jgi:hypothetical protein
VSITENRRTDRAVWSVSTGTGGGLKSGDSSGAARAVGSSDHEQEPGAPCPYPNFAHSGQCSPGA